MHCNLYYGTSIHLSARANARTAVKAKVSQSQLAVSDVLCFTGCIFYQTYFTVQAYTYTPLRIRYTERFSLSSARLTIFVLRSRFEMPVVPPKKPTRRRLPSVETIQHRLIIICFRDQFAHRILGYRVRTRISYTLRTIDGRIRLEKRPLRMYVRRPKPIS